MEREMSTPDKYDQEAERLLPCSENLGCWPTDDAINFHGSNCVAHRRPAVAAALREQGDKLDYRHALLEDLQAAYAAKLRRIEQLEAALKRVQDLSGNQGVVIEIARAALEGK